MYKNKCKSIIIYTIYLGGISVNNSMEKNYTTNTCKNCNGQIEIDISSEWSICPYCGTKYATKDILRESDSVIIEKIKADNAKTIEETKVQLEKEKLEVSLKEKQQLEKKQNATKFKKSVFSKILIIFAVLSGLFAATAFNDDKILAGFFAIIQLALFVYSWLTGVQIIGEKFKGAHIISAVLAFFLFIPIVNINNTSSTIKPKKFDWNNVELCEVIPEPDSNVGEIFSNTDEYLSIYVHKSNEDEYMEYINKCEDVGFIIDADKSKHRYTAYNDKGYKLTVNYFDYGNEFHITLDVPIDMDSFSWPKSEIGQIVPTPISNIGKIKWEYSGNFNIIVGSTTPNDYKEYVDECFDAGFNIDYKKSDVSYTAYDANGNYLSITYEGNNTITIIAKSNEDDNPKEAITNQENYESEPEKTDNIAETEQVSSKITVTMSEDELKTLTIDEAENSLKEMGFSEFERKPLETDDINLNNLVSSVEIKSWMFGKGDFSKGDSYETDAQIILCYYEYKEPEKPQPVYYSTNDKETAKNGNSGKFAYKKSGKFYDTYWLIDFDEGYVYNFPHGDGQMHCDKVKIVSGTLNDSLKVTWHDGSDEWSWYLHFKYVNFSETLIVVDHNGFDYEFTTTDLNKALEILNTKDIKEY